VYSFTENFLPNIHNNGV